MNLPKCSYYSSYFFKLLVCNKIRELLEYPKPIIVKNNSYKQKLLFFVFLMAYSKEGIPKVKSKIIRSFMFDPLIILLLRLILDRWKIWQAIPGIFRIVYLRMCNSKSSSLEITGYVANTDKEEPLIRVCLLLRATKRFGLCIELLIMRFNSGLPIEETKRWLSYFLQEIGENDAATSIFASNDCQRKDSFLHSLNSDTPHSSSYTEKKDQHKLKYGIIMLTMSDSDVFRASLLSLLNSDFHGQIVVVEDGGQTKKLCEEFCEQFPIKYIKNLNWTGVSGAVNIGIQQLEMDTDIIIYTHSDVLWSRKWFYQLDRAWNSVFDLDNVGLINLGYIQFSGSNSPDLKEMFIKGQYEDLLWMLTAMREISNCVGSVQNIQNIDMGRTFGLGRDAWNSINMIRTVTGRFSVGASFLRKTWLSLGGFDSEMAVGLDLELQYYNLKNRKWMLWINNTPMLHMVSTDTLNLNQNDQLIRAKMEMNTYQRFPTKYGWEIEHFIYTYFAETSIIYHDEIVAAANEMRFSDIDYIFDDFQKRLTNKSFSSCELVWCRDRSKCIY